MADVRPPPLLEDELFAGFDLTAQQYNLLRLLARRPRTGADARARRTARVACARHHADARQARRARVSDAVRARTTDRRAVLVAISDRRRRAARPDRRAASRVPRAAARAPVRERTEVADRAPEGRPCPARAARTAPGFDRLGNLTAQWPTTMSNTDVVVIGGGPSGATVSTLLAQKGYRGRTLRARSLPALPHRRVDDPGHVLRHRAHRAPARR